MLCQLTVVLAEVYIYCDQEPATSFITNRHI